MNQKYTSLSLSMLKVDSEEVNRLDKLTTAAPNMNDTFKKNTEFSRWYQVELPEIKIPNSRNEQCKDTLIEIHDMVNYSVVFK